MDLTREPDDGRCLVLAGQTTVIAVIVMEDGEDLKRIFFGWILPDPTHSRLRAIRDSVLEAQLGERGGEAFPSPPSPRGY